MIVIQHWCRVVESHERNTDATGADPSGVWRAVDIASQYGPTSAPIARCPVCGENVLEVADDGR